MPDVFPREAPEPRALLGWDGTAFRVVAVDAAGNVVLAPGGVNLQQFDSVWRFIGSGAGGAGWIVVGPPALGAGDLVVVTNAVAYITAGATTALAISVFDGATSYIASRVAPVVVDQVLALPNPVVLVAGDSLRFSAAGVGAGTVLQCSALGYYVRT